MKTPMASLTRARGEMAPAAQRRLVLGLIGVGLLGPLGGCDDGNWRGSKKQVTLPVVMYSYLNRAIIDVHFRAR